MDMTGEYRIPAPRQRVWEALNDPEVLKAAIPGCEELNKLSDNELDARVKAKVGPVSATFTGKVTLNDLNPPVSYRIVGEGKGGAAGFAKGGAEVALAEDGTDTILRYSAKADVGGKLAQIGSRLIQGTAKKMADDFFGRFSSIVAEQHAAEVAPAPPPAPEPPAPPAAPASQWEPAAARRAWRTAGSSVARSLGADSADAATGAQARGVPARAAANSRDHRHATAGRQARPTLVRLADRGGRRGDRPVLAAANAGLRLLLARLTLAGAEPSFCAQGKGVVLSRRRSGGRRPPGGGITGK